MHEEVIRKICDFAPEHGFSVLGLTFSPVKGPEGNIEYLAYLKKSDRPEPIREDEIVGLAKASHQELNGGE